MPETMTERAWRVDSLGTQAAAGERHEADTPCDSATAALGPAHASAAGRFKESRFMGRCTDVVRTWAKTAFERLGVQTRRFEAVLHEFTSMIETTHNPVALKMAPCARWSDWFRRIASN